MSTAVVAAKTAFYGLILCWWLFGLTFWLRKQPPRAKEAKRDPKSYLGLALQAAAYFIVWFSPLHRHQALPIAPRPAWLAWALAALILGIAAFSTWLVNAAARRLGKQWALAARLVDDHTLIEDGPYRFVRNPIYSGMFGMLIATGLAVGGWLSLLVAAFLFLLGTKVRISAEERLLLDAFGDRFEHYKRRVSALIPGIY